VRAFYACSALLLLAVVLLSLAVVFVFVLFLRSSSHVPRQSKTTTLNNRKGLREGPVDALTADRVFANEIAIAVHR
jgi:flagellar basal body-associated protein FliL